MEPWRLTMEPWRVYMGADSHHFDEEQDPDQHSSESRPELGPSDFFSLGDFRFWDDFLRIRNPLAGRDVVYLG